MFKKATKSQSKARVALDGPSGSGKTYTGLTIACALGSNPAVIDTERGSASKYSDRFSFDVAELEDFHPRRYIEAIRGAAAAGYDSLLIDSLSHAWSGKGGALELVDEAKAKYKGSSFHAWRDVTPLHNELVDAILTAPMHIVCTLRTKTEYQVTTNEKGKSHIQKIGSAPIQRDGMEYEFDIVADMDLENNAIISKSRCFELAGRVIKKPGKEFTDQLKAWLDDGLTVEQQLAGVFKGREVAAVRYFQSVNWIREDINELTPDMVTRILNNPEKVLYAIDQFVAKGAE